MNNITINKHCLGINYIMLINKGINMNFSQMILGIVIVFQFYGCGSN